MTFWREAAAIAVGITIADFVAAFLKTIIARAFDLPTRRSFRKGWWE